MRNKKGDVTWQMIALILFVAGLAIALLITAMILFSGGGFQDQAADTFCSIGVRGRSFLNLKGPIGAVSWHLFPRFCNTRPKDVYPDDWDECPYYKAEKENNPADFEDHKREYYKKCTTEQIAKLMVNCWKTNGANRLDPGNFECYSVCIKGTGDLTRVQKKLEDAEIDYSIAKAAYDKAAAKEDYPDKETKEWALKPLEENLKKAESGLTAAQDEYDKFLAAGKYVVSFDINYLRDKMKDANYTKSEKYSDILPANEDYIREAGTWEDTAFGKPFWASWWKDEEISTGQVISIFFKDGWEALFGLSELENDAIVLRFKTTC